MPEEARLATLEERMKHMPSQEQITLLRSDMMQAVDRAVDRFFRDQEKHEVKTIERVNDTVTKTVEHAFNLFWAKTEAKIEAAISSRIPERQRTDWKPYIMLGGFVFIAGVERAAPYFMRMMGAG